MLPLLALSSLRQAPPATWYGPATVTFHVEFAGDPYDPDVNDVRVQFLGEKAEKLERIAYYDGDGAYKAVLVAPTPGRYRPILFHNGQACQVQDDEGIVDVEQPLKHGFVRVDSVHPNRFRYDDGTPYYPMGFDLGWQNQGLLPMADQIAKMGKAGVNWSRIWASSWDGKNPWWPQNDPDANKNQLWAPALDKWQTLVDACDANGVAFQMVLFNHGSFSSTTDPNWPDHPWNAKNGGFLKDAADFFTDPEAKRRAKEWLRYAVARYAGSPSILAWELFNEVQWVDAVKANRWPDVVAWHKEMADYVRSIDPYRHLVTTSSVLEPADLWTAMDYRQPHVYTDAVLDAVADSRFPADKPAFYGEFGPNDLHTDLRRVVRDGIYGAMLANHAGTAMFWYWDEVEKQNLYSEFATAAKVIAASGIANQPEAHPLNVVVSTPGVADLALHPGGGWGPFAHPTLNLPQDANPATLGGVPSYFQSTSGGHKDIAAPLELRFQARQPGVVKISLGTVAKAGAHLVASVNGKAVVTKDFPAAAGDTPQSFVLEIPYKAGPTVVRLENTGGDWIQLGQIVVPGLAPEARALAVGHTSWMMLRLTAAPGASTPIKATVGGISLNPGAYKVTTFDLATGNSSTASLTVSNSTLKDLPLATPDAILVFTPTP